ncbi:MAG: DNA-3-methyladenine glycosylase [Polyangiales bacterium]
MPHLPAAFFAAPAHVVAPRLLGAVLVRRLAPRRLLRCRIVEVEAYGPGDPACHAFRGPTARNAAMFAAPGRAYVYLIYGMYHCLNLVTDRAGVGSAVLIRAVELPPAAPTGQHLSARQQQRQAAGPGKLCRALGIDLRHNGHRLHPAEALWVEPPPSAPVVEPVQCSRIGISVGTELPWRWYDAGSAAVSVRATGLEQGWLQPPTCTAPLPPVTRARSERRSEDVLQQDRDER